MGLELLEGRVTPAGTTTVSLDAAGNLRIDDTDGGDTNDDITIQADATNNRFVISDSINTIGTSIAGATGDGTNTVTVPFSSVVGGAIFVSTLAGDDFLTVDLNQGDFAQTITYDGGANGAGGDELRLQGGGVFANVTHTFTSVSAGSVAVTGNAPISYSGLEPVTDNLSATDRVFAFTGGTETITLSAAVGTPFNLVIDSSLGESVLFNDPTSSLTIDAGTGNDTVLINNVVGTFPASLIINGGLGDDTVNLNGDITFAANRNLDVDLQNDDATPGTDQISVGANANLVLAGTGTAILTASRNISLATGSSIVTANGALTLAANQQAAATGGTFVGVAVNGATVQSTGSGPVQVSGRGGTSGVNNYGVRVTGTTGVVQSGSGPLQMTGTGGASSGSGNAGVFVETSGPNIGSTGGNVQVTGFGGGAGSSFGNTGVLIRSGLIASGGAGTVTVQGAGGTTSGGPNRGIELFGGGITSSGGAVQVTGTGGAVPGTNGNNVGVFVSATGQISAGGTGAVNVHGTGSSAGGINNHGVVVTGDISRITSGGGNIQVTGVQGAGSGSFAIVLSASGSVVSVGSANIDLIGDSMSFDSTAIVAGGTNSVTLRQRTNGVAITLNAVDAGVLGLTDAELDRVTAATLNIGDSNSGTITVSSTISRPAPTLMNLTTGSDIALLGLLVDAFAVVNLNAPAGSITTPPGSSAAAPDVRAATLNVDGVVAPGGASAGQFAVDGSLVFSSTDRYRAQLNGPTAFTQYDVISTTGTANLGSATLEVLPGFTPSIGQLFTIVNTSGGVAGTFRDPSGNPLPEGATFNANGITFLITYQGGADGRDVVLRAETTGLTISISDASVVETNAGTTTITFNVTLSAPGNQTIAVNWATADGTAATADNDYVGASGTVGFGIGDTSEQVTITVNGDLKFELDETFTVNLSNPVNATLADGTGLATIQNDDAQPTVSVTGPPPVPEAFPGMVMRADFTVTLSNPSQQTVTVTYATGDDTATGAIDYASTTGTLTFNPGETSNTVSVNVFGDTTYEPNETFNFNLTSATNATIPSPGSVTATIVDDDPVPSITVGNFSGLERDPGSATSFLFQASLSNPSYQTITVNYTTADGTAVAGSDYTVTSGTVTFTPGQTVQDILVPVTPDQDYEPDETFSVVLSSPTNADLGSPSTGTGTILNDDSRPTISISDLSMAEGNSVITEHFFTVSLSNASAETVTVNFTTADGTALVTDNDYEPSSGVVTFSPGQTSQTVGVLIIGDTKFEAGETFTANLSNPVNATIADGQGVGAILNDDNQPWLTLSIAKDWSFQTVDSLGDVGAWSSLEIGSDNQPRIAYEDRSTSSRNLKYASFDGAAWSIQTVHDDATDIVGQEASLALDSLNRPHIAYQNFSDTQLLYAHHNGTSWVLETANPNSYLHNSVDVDSQNRPLVSSFNSNTFDLNLARRVGGTWSVETPDGTNDATGFHTSLAVDAADNPWITFVNGTARTLTLARHDGAAWQFQTIDSGSDFRDSSLVLDSLGRPHVSYYDFGTNGTRQHLKYAFFDGAAWTITTVDANNAGEHNSLALDSLGRPRIAYIGSGAARFASFDGSAWTTQFVGAQANYTSLALDQDDLASISYYSTTTGDLVLASQVTASMSENGGSKLATVSRTDTAGELTVNLLSNDTTEATVVASVVLADGQATSAPFNINAVDDSIVDGTQTVTITASAAGYVGDTDTVNVTDDDPTVTLSLAGSPLAENGGVATVTATLSAVSGQNVTVDLGFTGAATHPTDYARSGTSIVIAAGSTTGSVTLTGVDDPTDEANETIIVDIIGVTNGTEAGTQQVTATITDDDLPPSLSINDVTVTEGNAGSVSATFTVSLSQASGQTVTVSAATADNSAVAPEDYTAAPATLVSFAPGQTTRTFTVQVQGDLLDEINETYFVNLGGAVNATILDGQGVGAITDDDGPPSISINDVSLLEGNSGTAAVVFTVSLSNASGQSVSVDFATADGSATLADSDYQGSAGSVTFAPGTTSQTITVLVNGDAKFEPNETFTVNLSGSVNATITDSTGLGTIENDDTQPTISIDDASLAEGNAGAASFVFTVSLSNASSQTITVDFATADGSATLADSDYQSANGTLTFNPGQTSQTLTVLVNGDTRFEVDETFSVGLAGAANATIIDPSGLGTIRNDDAEEECDGTIELIDGVLTIHGTVGDDSVHVSRQGGGKNPQILVQASFPDGGAQVSFAESSIRRIVILLCDGNDEASVAGKVGLDLSIDGEAGNDQLSAGGGAALLRGGPGNDLLQGGSQNDMLIGGDGDDVLNGGGGLDLLIGGAGADLLDGGLGDDILVAGTTDHDAHDSALIDIMLEWTSKHNLQQRVNNLKNGAGGGSGGPRNGTTFLNALTVHDDGAMDQLTGGGGSDWFLYNFSGSGVEDVATDAGSSETGIRLDL